MSNFQNILDNLKNSQDLSTDEAFIVSEKMFEGSLADDQIKDIILLLNKKNIYSNELIGFAIAMRKIAHKASRRRKPP